MTMKLLRVLDDRFQADLWCGALDDAGIEYRLRTYQDTAYDGLFVSQKGYASLYVHQDQMERAQELDQALAAQTLTGEMGLVDLARRLDHTLLDPDAGLAELNLHLAQCLEMGAAAACVLPWMVPLAVRQLSDSPVAVCTVVDFPLGADSGQGKATAARLASQAGAQELDLVLNRGLIRSGRLDESLDQVVQVVEAVPGRVIKVILEMNRLGPELSREVALGLKDIGIAFVKTGTGTQGGATVEQVELLAQTVGSDLEIKAAGGIRDLEGALAMIKAGADRLGTSSGHAIWTEAKEKWGPAES